MHGSAEALPQPARPTGLVAVIAISTAIALLGALIAFKPVAPGHDRAAALPGGPFGTHQQVPMSFGAVSVDAVEKLGAVPVHGPRNAIANDVAPGQVSVRTTISVSNLLDRAIHFTPAWFRLLAGAKKRPIALAQATMAAGRVEGQALIEGRLSFVVPERSRPLWLEVRDPGRRRPVLIDLGRAGRTPAGAFDSFGHLHRGGS